MLTFNQRWGNGIFYMQCPLHICKAPSTMSLNCIIWRYSRNEILPADALIAEYVWLTVAQIDKIPIFIGLNFVFRSIVSNFKFTVVECTGFPVTLQAVSTVQYWKAITKHNNVIFETLKYLDYQIKAVADFPTPWLPLWLAPWDHLWPKLSP